MYNRDKKDSYRKKIEQLIGGRKKRSRKDSSSNSNDANNNITISSNDNTNDDDTSNKNIDDDTNEIGSTSRIHIQKWIPGNRKIEGIRKYIGINKLTYN